MFQIPKVDFNVFSIDKEDIDLESGKQLTQEIADAFTTIGFVYLVNHGIPQDLLEKATDITEEFFKQPIVKKQKYARPKDENYGWVSLEREKLNPERPADLKEAFNVDFDPKQSWPSDDFPDLESCSRDIFRQCNVLTDRVLTAMAVGLKLQDREFFSKAHKGRDSRTCSTTLRYLYYPPLTADIKAGQIRCGEHSDYGSITLLFQDNVGGLQLYTRDGQWVDAKPVPGAVLVNVGDLMQRWTSDKLVSTKHRVVIPEAEIGRKQTRRSMAYFAHPDNGVMISCFDGSDKYEPISPLDYLKMRFAATYTY